MDQRSYRLSNRILNNTLGTPALEITLMGPKLQFEERALIAITGADMNPVLDGIAINMNQAVLGILFVLRACAVGTSCFEKRG